ncbi:MAG: metallophosphoesterase [Turicibacter sp.]|nr:metallophosphoesterase [Turicibacter sp.]
MKTLIIGDTHLMCRLILPRVSEFILELDIKRVILTGDYTDQWGGTNRDDWYQDDLRFLYRWKQEMISQRIEVILLTGNHDIPYLTNQPAYYSAENPATFQWIREMLFDLELQIAYQLGDFLISHAGYTEDYRLEEWHLETLTPEHEGGLIWLNRHVGLSRSGTYVTGSPVWADLNYDLLPFYNKDYPLQIVGHTPIANIDINQTIIGIDSFSLTRSHFPVGSGEMLLYEDGKLSVIENISWNSDANQKAINRYFEV